MKKHKLFKNLPPKGKFHSCILSSFSFDYHFFDRQIRNQLHAKGIFNILLLCDARILDQNFGLFSFGTRHLSSDYTISAIESKGVFHPKVSIFIGEKDLMMHLGSGNLTSTGMGKNHELFSTFSTNTKDDAQFNLIKTGLDYLVGFLQKKSGFVKQQLDWIKTHCDLIDNFEKPIFNQPYTLNEELKISCFSNYEHTSIYESLQTTIPLAAVDEVTIISPYYDKDGHFLKRLSTECSKARINLVIQKDHTLLPENFEWTNSFHYLDWYATDRAIKAKAFKFGRRLNHSKIFIFNTTDKTYLLHGSSNATAPAFGIHPYRNNEEIALLFELPYQNIAAAIGVQSDVPIELPGMAQPMAMPVPEQSEGIKQSAIKILGADKYRTHLEVFFSGNLAADIDLVFLNARGAAIELDLMIEKSNKRIRLSLTDYPGLHKAAAVCLYRSGEKVSHLSFINEISFLQKANPSKPNRKLQEMLSKIQIGNLDEFNLFNHLGAIFKNAYNEKSEDLVQTPKQSNLNTATNKQLNYEEAKRLAEQKEWSHHPLGSAKPTMDALNFLFHYIKGVNESKVVNEEEEGAKSDGGKSSSEQTIYQAKVFTNLKKFENSRTSVLNQFYRYLKYLKLLLEKEEQVISPPDLCFFMILYYQLLHLADKVYTLKSEDGEEQQMMMIPKKGTITEEDSLVSLSLSMLGYFLHYLNKFPFQVFEDQYSNKELEIYKQQAGVLIYYGLAIQLTLNPKHQEWIALLWNNTEKRLATFDQAAFLRLADAMQKEIAVGLPSISLKTINTLKVNSQEIDQSLEKDIVEKDFFYIQGAGVFKIIQKIKLPKPKALKLSFPGIEYDTIKGNYLFPRLYSFEKEKLLKPRRE